MMNDLIHCNRLLDAANQKIDHLQEQIGQQAKEIGELRERIDRQATTITEYQAENETLREALRNIIECEDQWTRHDMVREAKHALKEVPG